LEVDEKPFLKKPSIVVVRIVERKPAGRYSGESIECIHRFVPIQPGWKLIEIDSTEKVADKNKKDESHPEEQFGTTRSNRIY